MRLPSFVSVILVFLLALVAGGIGYAIGVNSAVATTAAAASDGTVVVGYAPWFHGFWFFPLFGLFFAFLFFAIIFSLIRRAAWGGPRGWRGSWYGYGYGYDPKSGGPGSPAGSGPTSGSVPPGVEQMLQDWHTHVHGDPNATTGSTGTTTSQNPPPRG